MLRPSDFQTQYRLVNGLRMHMAVEGAEGAPLVLLLHGFPEFWYSWRYQIKALAAAGYRVVAPDQRGYNLTDKHGPYDVFQLSDDIANLIAKLGYEKAHAVIGHDWGGVVTWTFGARYPKLLDKLIVCNVPHPATLSKSLRQVFLPQILKSWYMTFFQIPELPERLVAQDDYRGLAAQLNRETKGKVTREEIQYFVEAWRQPGAIGGGINWYRALYRNFGRIARTDLRVHVPSLLIWGEDDNYLTKQTAEWSRETVDDLEIQYLPGISHWVQQEAPEQVNSAILTFLKG
jgi:epoxide hydrolase 4